MDPQSERRSPTSTTGDPYETKAIEQDLSEYQAHTPSAPRLFDFIPAVRQPEKKFTKAVVTCHMEVLELMKTFSILGFPLTKVLFTCTGLDDSRKFEVIKNALGVHDIAVPLNPASVPAAGFTQYHLTACNRLDKHFDFTTIDRKDLTVQNFKKALFIALSLARYIIETSENLVVQQQYSDDPVDLDTSVHAVLCQLKEMSTDDNISFLKSFASFGLLNVWDIGLNRTVRPFLESFSGCFPNNFPFLFISVKEAQTLYAPPNPKSHSDGDFKWRSTIQYLLRSCQLALGSNKIICTVYVTYDADNDNTHEIETAYEHVKKFSELTFQQMQIKEKVECDVYKIPQKGDCGHLIDRMKSLVAEYGKAEQTKISYLFLRCILAEHVKKSCIKREELKSLADSIGQEMTYEDIENFCQLFTSFGSILDVKQVNASSDLVIIKPNVFLNEMEQFLKQPDVQKSNILEVFHDREMMIQVLVDVGLAVYHKIADPIAGPCERSLKEVWLSSALKFHDHKQNFTKGAIQFVLGLGAPRLNLNITVFEKMINSNFKLVDFKASNAVVFRIPCVVKQGSKDYIDVTLSFMGDVIEISLANSENITPGSEHEKSVCSKLIYIFKESVESCLCQQRFKDLESTSIKYHFAVLCLKDAFKHKTLFHSAYRRRHILPANKLCFECQNDIDFKYCLPLIDTWKSLLESKHEIPSHLKLNGEFSMETIVMLTKRLAKFPWDDIKRLAIELQVESDTNLQNKPENVNKKELAILHMLVKWAENKNRQNQPDSLRTVMAEKLHDAKDGCCQESIKNEFKKLATEVDMQVLTKEQRKEVMAAIQRDYTELDQEQSNEQAPIPTSTGDIKSFVKSNHHM